MNPQPSRHIPRPELHITPEIGVLDAPAGALYDGSHWHVFTQFTPQPTSGARWAHQVSEDTPFQWEICNDVIAPEGEETTVRAGSVVAHGHETWLYFTSVSQEGDEIHLAVVDDLDATLEDLSDEGSAVDPHVQRRGTVVRNHDGWTNFRSPCVLTSHDDRGGWLMLAVTGSTDAPQLVMLHSHDGLEWSVDGPLTLTGETGLAQDPLVAPRFLRLQDQVDGEVYDILLVTIEFNGVDRSGYLVGKLRANEFEALEPFTPIDYGHDFGRPRNANVAHPQATNDEAVLIGFMNGRGRRDTPTEHLSYTSGRWANCLTLPRSVTLQHRKLYQTPVAGLPEAINYSSAARLFSGVFDVPAGASVSVSLLDSLGQEAARITHRGDLLELDRSMNPMHASDDPAVAPLSVDDTDAVTIITDGSTVEVFADGGQVAMASRVIFNGTCEDFLIEASSEASVERFDEIGPVETAGDINEGVIR